MGVRISPPVLVLRHIKIKSMLGSINKYIKESKEELSKKVSWPAWSELQSSALLVMVSSLIIGLIVWAMDIGFENIMKFAYQQVTG